MKSYLTQSERDEILSSLSEEQRLYLVEEMKRGKQTAFGNVLAQKRNESGNWELIDYIDGGQVSPDLKCECGRSLRFQYVIRDLGDKRIRKFGIQHFEEHTGIPPEIVREIKKGFQKIDYELDEIFSKIKDGLYGYSSFNFDSKIQLPTDIQRHFSLKLPLLERQIKKIKELLNQYHKQELEKQRLKLSQELKSEQQEAIRNFYNRTNKNYKVNNINNGSSYSSNYQYKHTPHNNVSNSNVSTVNKSIEEAIEYYFMNVADEVSALDLCYFLIEHFNADCGTYSTGRPKIYADVCSYLYSLCNVKKMNKRKIANDFVFSKVH